MTKILFLAANPFDTDRLQLDEEVRAIDAALRQTEFRDQFDLQPHWAVRVSDLQELLLRHQPEIVHFSGHGSTAGEIILHDEQGKAVTVLTEALSHLFSLFKDNIRCVVLSACYSDGQATSIAQHIDCVVGMSDAVSDKAARDFATAFYRALGYGRSVQAAFDLGTSQINLRNLQEQDKPKLIASRGDPTQMVLAEEFTPMSNDNDDTIRAEIGSEAKNVNVGKTISAAHIGNVAGGLHGSPVAGRDVITTFNTHNDNRYWIGLFIAVFIVIAACVFWYGKNIQKYLFSSPVPVILSSPLAPTPTGEALAFAPATPEETLIIVPLYDNRSEGQLPGVNPSSQIYDLVFKAALDNHQAKVRVEYYEQAIGSSQEAQTLGAQYKAKIVLWGWYNSLKVQPYVELVGERTIQGEGVPIATPTPMAFYFLEEIPAQAAYLGLFLMGMAHIVLDSQTELQQAIAFFTSALDAIATGVQTNPWEAYVWRANCYTWLKEYARSLPDYDQAIRLKPNDASAYSNRGSAYIALGQHEKAIHDYNEAIRLNPDAPGPYFGRAIAYGALGQHEQAIQDYTEAIRLNPDYADAYYNRAIDYRAMGQHEQAIKEYTEAIRLKPDDADAYYGKGIDYGALGQYEQAIKEYTEAIRLNPDYEFAYFNRGYAYQSLQEYKLAIADFEKFLSISDDSYWRKEAERHLAELRNQ